MRRAAQAFFLGLALAAVAGSALAASVLHVGVSESRRVVLHGSAANVIVADPTVADVAMVDAHSVIVIGRGYGATSVMVLDHSGRTLLDSRVVVSAPEEGRVTLHRGAAAAEFACSPRCQATGVVTTTSQTAGPSPMGASPAAAPSAPQAGQPGV
jgi:Flp pilus assembly secretin CpaC